MSISAIVPSLASLPATSHGSVADQIAQALKDLQTSLTAGNADAAKTAFATLQKLEQGSATQNASSNSTLLNAGLQTLGQALDSGNVAAAQDAFTAVQGLLTRPPPQPSQQTSPALSVAYVVNLLSTLPGSTDATTTDSSDIGFNLLSSISVADSASINASITAAQASTTNGATSPASAAATAAQVQAQAAATELNLYA